MARLLAWPVPLSEMAPALAAGLNGTIAPWAELLPIAAIDTELGARQVEKFSAVLPMAA